MFEVGAAWGEVEQKSSGASKKTSDISEEAKAAKKSFDDATDAINKFYSLQIKVAKLGTDIEYNKDAKVYTSKSGTWDEYARQLTDTRLLYEKLTKEENQASFTEEQRAEIVSLLTDKINELNLVLEEQNNKASKTSSIKTIGEEAGTAQKELDNLIIDIERLKEKYKDSTKRIRLDTISVSVGDGVDSGVVETSADDAATASEAFDRLVRLVQQYKLELSSDTSQESFSKKKKELRTQIDAVRKALEEEADVKRNSEKADAQNLRDSNALSKAIVATNRAYKQATEALQKYTAAKNGKSSKQYADIEREAASLKLLEERLHNGTISQQEYVRETNKARAVIQEATAIIKANGEAHLSLGDKIKVAASKFSQYFGIAKVVNLAWRATRQMVQATIELDDAFTQLKIVTGATDSEMEKFSDTAIKLSKNLGQSVADVTKSIETFSRLGYNLPDASKLTEYATILANTAAVSMDEATTGLTSIIKGFQLDVEDAEHVSDVLIQVGQKYAVSAGELMEAFERSGAALNATNVSFEKAAGLIAAANASVQDSSTIGTALKTVSARIRGKLCLNIA